VLSLVISAVNPLETKSWISKSIKVSLIAVNNIIVKKVSLKVSIITVNVRQTWISKSNKVSLIVVNNIIVKKVSLKVSLIPVNVIDYHFHLLQ
jgi:hypothetical protein